MCSRCGVLCAEPLTPYLSGGTFALSPGALILPAWTAPAKPAGTRRGQVGGSGTTFPWPFDCRGDGPAARDQLDGCAGHLLVRLRHPDLAHELQASTAGGNVSARHLPLRSACLCKRARSPNCVCVCVRGAWSPSMPVPPLRPGGGQAHKSQESHTNHLSLMVCCAGGARLGCRGTGPRRQHPSAQTCESVACLTASRPPPWSAGARQHNIAAKRAATSTGKSLGIARAAP